MRIIHDKYDLGELANRIQSVRSSEHGQPITFRGFHIDDIQSVLETCIDFNPAVSESDREGLIWQGITQAAEHAKIDAARLEQSLRQAERNYLRRPLQDYVVASSLSIDYFDALTKTNIEGITIIFSRSLPRRFSREGIQRNLDEATAIEQSHRFLTVRTRVRARTDGAAVNIAFDTADYLRGIWNYWINARTRMRHRIGSPKPVNKILWGPVHTLHTPQGALATETFWVEPKHQQFDDLYRMAADWDRIRKWEKHVRLQLNNVQYANDLKHLFARYARALDIADYDVAFNKLWGVFEHLAGAIGSYETLIKRTLFLWTREEREYARLILEHLRDVRNGSVHEDRSRRYVDRYIYQLKWFVEALFKFHLSWGREFSSLSMAGQFLDLPQDLQLLNKRMAEYRRAVRFQTPTPETS